MKLIAASVALMTSFSAVAGLGGLNVQSNLGEPFSGSITVTGDEAKALLNGGKATVSNGNLRTSVRKSGDKAIISIRSSQPIQDPVLIFQVGAGSQSREYTAIIDPADYASKPDGSSRARINNNNQTTKVEPASAPKSQNVDREAARERISRIVNSEEAEYQEPVQATKPKITGRQTQIANEKEYSNISYGKRHLVLNGETLLGISARIRPQGMSVAETMRALVNANPTVFIENNADRMLAGKVLNIPARDEMKRLAAQPPAVKVPAENAAQALDQAQQNAQKPQQVEQPAVAAPSGAKPASDAQAKDKNIQETVPETVKPIENEVRAASEAVVSPASDVDAGAASAAERLPKQTVEQQEQVRPSEENIPSEEGGLWRWLLIGGASLVVLLLLAKLLAGRKAGEQKIVVPVAKQHSDEDEEDEEGFSFSSVNSSLEEQKFAVETKSTEEAEEIESPKAKPEVHVGFDEKGTSKEPSTEEGLAIEDDFDDDIFFTQATEENVADKDDVKVDWNSVEAVQSSIVSSAVTTDEETEKRRNADWDTIESTESVYEPDTEPSFLSSNQPSVIKKEEVEVKEDEVLDFFAVDEAEENKEENLPLSQKIYQEREKDLDNNINGDKESASSELLDFEMPSPEEDKESNKAIEEPSLETEEITFEEKHDSDSSEVFAVRQDRGLSFQDSTDFDEQPLQIDETDGNVDWEDIAVEDVDGASNENSSFISESVGMTAPFEAKYELAKMYVEIGDPAAARETLQELLEESQGAILDKAKEMLKELDS